MRPILNIGVQAIRSASRVMLQSLDRLDSLKNEPNKRLNEMQSLLENVVYSMQQTIIKVYPKHEIQWQGQSDTLPTQPLWLLQPVAGLRNFQHDIPHFALTISHLVDKITQVALIYDPLRDELYSATLGQGAFMNQRRIRASQHKDLDTAVIATNHYNAALNALPKTHIRQSGCTSLDLAYVAHGRIHGFVGEAIDNEYAGLLLIKESGAMQQTTPQPSGSTLNCVAASGLMDQIKVK
mgnify:CR=1 FL=1